MKSAAQMSLFPFEQTKARNQRPRSLSIVRHELERRISTLRRMQSRLTLRAAPVRELLTSVASRPFGEISELVAFLYWNAEGIVGEEQISEELRITVNELRAKVPALKIPRQCKSCNQRCVVTVRRRDEREEALTHGVVCQSCMSSEALRPSEGERRPNPATDLISMQPVGRIQ